MRKKNGSSDQVRGFVLGFTLIELTVVLAVIAAMMGTTIALVSASLESKSHNGTVAKLQALQQALADYRIAYNKLPCPALMTLSASVAGFGTAVASTSPCTGADIADAASAVGMVPVRTLGLPDEMAFDAWGRRIRYAVSPVFVASDAFDGATVTPGDTTTRITINNNANNASLSTTALFVLMSHGKNGHGGRGAGSTATPTLLNAGITNANELINCKCNADATANTATPATFVQGDPTLNASNSLENFDDIVVFSNRADLRDATE